MKPIYLIACLVSFKLFSETPIDSFNVLIKEDLTFVYKSLNRESNKQSSSSGNLVHSDDLITIMVKEPFKERYEINASSIDIYDYDFDQYKKIYLDDVQDNMINYLINGIRDDASIINLSNNSFTIDNNFNEVYVEIINNKKFFIKSEDNMGAINMITFEVY